MPIIVVCPHCRSRARVARNTSGREVRCTGCRASFRVHEGTGDLTVEWGPVGVGRRFPLDPGRPFNIGRARDNCLILPGALVSRHHAMLKWAEGEWRLTDLGSANGTFVNGRRVEDIGLTDGGRIVVGEFALRLGLTTAGAGEPEASLDAMAMEESATGATAVVEAGPHGAEFDAAADTLRGAVRLDIGEGPAADLPPLTSLRRGWKINRPLVRRGLIALSLVLIGGLILTAVRQCG